MQVRPWAVLLIGAALAAGALVWCRSQPDAGAVAYELTGSIEDIMAGMIDPSAETIFQSVAVINSAAGVEERRPRSDADWARVEHAALTLAEAANLLRMPGRIVAGANRRTDQQTAAVPELDPGQIQQRIDADRAEWIRHTDALIEQARRTLAYARARNVQGLFDVGGPLDEACESCHAVYWFPDAPRPPNEGVRP